MTSGRPILSVSLNAAGWHAAAWRLPHVRAGDAVSGAHYRDLAQTAERAGLDMIALGYPPRGSALAAAERGDAVGLDALSLAAALVPVTGSIGLCAAQPATWWEPFNIARAFSGLDNLSRGRLAWLADAAFREADLANYSRLGDVDPATLAARTVEVMDVVFALWDSWEDDALVFDKENARFTDPAKVHRIDHAGAFFKVEGPLNSPRSPQGRPLVVEIDASPDGLELAARTADVLIIRRRTIEAAAAVTRAVKADAASQGRTLLVLADLAATFDLPERSGPTRLKALDALAPAAPSDRPHYAGPASGLADLARAWRAAGACDGFNLLPSVFPHDLAALADAGMAKPGAGA